MVVAWATGRHARRGGHGQLLSCSAWIPPVPCHHENERKKEGWRERGSEQVSRCDLCWHCMSMLMKKKGGGRERYAPCLFMLLSFGCLPATALFRAGVPHTHAPSSSHPQHHHCALSCTRCMCMHVCVSAQCAAHT